MEEIKDLKKGKVNLELQRKKDRQPVEGIFRFHEVPGGTLNFVYRCYKGDPIEKFSLVDGQRYSLPLGVAKHLNTNCAYDEYGFIDGQSGPKGIRTAVPPMGWADTSTMKVSRKVRRCSFQSLEFMDLGESEAKKVVLVERA